ncbi:hypothetical protein D3C80_1971970 [compost metagenome]
MLLDRVEGKIDTFADIVLPALVGQPGVRVDPRDHEHAVTLIETPFNEGFLWVEIEDIKFVDPWRHDEQRPFEGLFRRRRVMDDLAERAFGNHLA